MISGLTCLRWGFAAGLLLIAAGVGLAQTPSQALFVVLENEKMVAIVDPASGKIAGRVPTDENPNGVAATPDGRLAITANLRPGTLSVIDVAARRERRVNVGRGSQPNDILASGGKFFFTARGYKAVGRFDPATNDLDWFGVGQNETHILAVSGNGTIFASNRGSNSVSIIEGAQAGPSKWTVTNIPISASPDGVALSADGRELWAGIQGGGGLAVIDVASRKVSRINVAFQKASPDGSQAARLQISPDGRRAFLLNRPTQEVVVVDTMGRKEIKRFKLAGQSILSAPNGRTYVSVADEGYIAVIDSQKLEISGKIQMGGSPNAMAWAGGK